ncbi:MULTISPECIES: hypothetical protein [unclassified Cryobacterium]|nr:MULTISPECIES: hypothetical protein [unclassified Cryobacterium]
MDDLDWIDAPHCPSCLAPCTPAGTVERPFWVCPSCRVAVLVR